MNGSHVFAYRYEWQDTDEVFLLVGGYNSYETRKFGFYLPWPPVIGEFGSSLSMAYYDPFEDENDPNNLDDQYGSSGFEGWVKLHSITFLSDSTVDKIDVSFGFVDLVNSASEHLCLNSGKLKKDWWYE